MSIEDDLTGEVMAILKDEDAKVAVMVASMVLIRCLQLAVERGHGVVATEMLKEAMDIADQMKRGRAQ